MFTGLVQATGRLKWLPGAIGVSLERRPQGERQPEGLAEPKLGDSIAVDGVCLTVRRIIANGFEADVSPETLHRTTLGILARQGGRVNLEPALRLADRLGGHLVSGHVDGLGRVHSLAAAGGAWEIEIGWENPLLGRYICEKSSVAVNGVSLTVASCSQDGATFRLAVIPHTWESTTLQYLGGGDPVNLEADLIAKYVERLLPVGMLNKTSTFSAQWLAEQGWNP
jgi:riboflavin synthase